jgi:hypothetical protein
MLESIRDVVDGIIVIDGAYKNYLEHFKEFNDWATAWSTDGSMEIINNFRGLPEVHIYKTPNDSVCWPNQVEKRNFLLSTVPDGDAFLGIDADEMIMGDVQEGVEKFYESGCIACSMPLYMPGTHMDRVVPRWHPRVFVKRKGMHYTGTHWHLRDLNDRIIEEKYPIFWTDVMAIVHFKAFKDQTRLIPDATYKLAMGDRANIEPEKGEKLSKEVKPWKNENVEKLESM